ncbi:MAG: hypothetical protein EXQ51_05385 [Acidobacteria bacterium]|nr:hypothetical protein [Acidobacteriota bacterium]
MWILSWGAEHLPQLLTGGMSWTQFWDANIFHPAPLGLALSEHLFGQVLQILPVYWLTGNIILCYNLLFISTFVLAAYGTYLLVYDLTGDRRAAFVAGLVYGFLPYRIASVPHLQVMSSQWMPFALWGLNRFVTTNSYKALVGGTAALVMQNWSCGYYLLYFAPFAPLFVLHRMWSLGTLRNVRTWLGLLAAAVGTLVLTLPFLIPYTQAQQQFGFERPFGEVVRFSANVWSYVTASESLWLFGKALRYYPHGEGETFVGFVPWLLAFVALIALVAAPGSDPEQEVKRGLTPPSPLWKRALIVLLAVVVITQFIAVVSAVVFGGFNVDVLAVPIRARSPQRLLWQFAAAAALLLMVSPRTRVTTMRAARSPLSFFAVATVLAMWLSLGPVPKAGDALVSGFGLYGIFYEYVPGFNGVRVPARYAMIAGLFLAVMAGYGMAAIVRGGQTPRHSILGVRPLAVGVIALLILIEGAAIPLPMNGTWGQNEATPPARVFPPGSPGHRVLGEGVPPVYAAVAALPAGSAITEFPFGDAAWEIRYVYYSAAHWKPITNGYSGSFPPDYSARVARLKDVTINPAASWQSLLDSGSSHVVLHPVAFANPVHSTTVQTWLEAHGARLVATFDDKDALYAIR